MANLDIELNTYRAKLPTLLSEVGKFVLIKGDSVEGIFDSYQDALSRGYEKFDLEPFLVKHIAPTEQVAFFTRDFASACPA